MAVPAVLAVLLSMQVAQLPPSQIPTAAEAAPMPVEDPMASTAMRNDARLNDVCFVDAEHGWAVGDRGAIWHTEDGGRQWQMQRSGVACSLESVCFLDRQVGFAAGGQSHPYTHTSSAVLLMTQDGGQHWRSHARLALPKLKRIRFLDEKNGWAVGCSSAMYPTGVFVTDSGGLSFQPLSGEKTRGWTAGALLDLNTGALVGRDGAVAMIQRGGVRRASMGSFGLRTVADLQLMAPIYGWLVGDGGLVMATTDLGSSWQTPASELPEGATQFDFKALAVRGPKCWVAGSPGTCVFHTPDGGRTWTSYRTGGSLPIHALTFADDQRGWAVGSLGTVLATEDGGQTWQRQRAGGARAALLGLFSEPGDLPLELFAQLSGDEGYLGVIEVLNRRDVEVLPDAPTPTAERLHEAAVAVGACEAEIAWQFPLRQAGLKMGAERIVDGWDRANDGRGLAELEQHIVRQIRLWRPDVIVTHSRLPGGDAAGGLLGHLIAQAIERAADPTFLTEQITRAGLEPWRVRKVYGASPTGDNGSVTVTTSQLAVRLGRSLAEVAAGPRGLLEDRFSTAEATLGFDPVCSSADGEPSGREFFSGLVLAPGSEARRQLNSLPSDSLSLLRRTAQRRRNVKAILQRAEEDPQQGAQLLGQTGDLVRGMDAESAGRILYHLAQKYYRTGQWSMAAETFTLLTDRYPTHPLSRPALVWLVQYYAGCEPAWRVHGGQRFAVHQASAPAVDPQQLEDRPARATELGKQIERSQPELYADPALRFPLAVAQRNHGFPGEAERFYLAQSRGATQDAWWACALGESWLAEPKGLPPKSVLHCAAATAKPRLDGRFDDAVWQRAKRAELRSALGEDAAWPATVMLAYDREFLYLAVECGQAPDTRYESSPGPRPRDPDLGEQDRVELFLDLDRDFATYFRLTIDHRGFTGEGCWGDSTWDPTWFVAAETSEGTWRAEAAIPLDQLTGRYPTSQTVWAIGIQRTAPGTGFQSWTTPAATDVRPEGFGYLIFD